MELIVSILTALANIVLGLFTFYKNPKSDTNKLLAAMASIIGLWAITNYFSLNSPSTELTLFWIRVVMVITSFLGPTALLLTLVFPKTKLEIPNWFRNFLLFLVVLSTSLSVTPLMFSGVEIINGNIQPEPGPGILVFALSFIGGFIASILVLGYKFYKSSGILRQQLKFVVAGMLLTFFLMGLNSFILVVVFNISDFVVFGPTFSLILVGSISYAIIRHRLLDISFIVARAVAFTLLLVAIIGVFASLFLSLPALLPEQYHSVATILAAILLAFAFNPIRRVLERNTERILHKRSYDPNNLIETLSEDLRSNISLNTLSSKVFGRLKDTLKPTAGAFILSGKDGRQIIKNFDFDPVPDLTSDQISKLAKKSKSGILVQEEMQSGKHRDWMVDNNISILIPLRANQELHGVLLLGPKASGEIYSTQDINVLEILGPQISIAIQNSLAYDEIKQFNTRLKAEIKEATADLRKANKELKELDKLKDEFVYIATHELKTPITVIKGYLSLFEDGTYGEIPDNFKEPLLEIQSASQQMQLLINDLLDIARSEVSQTKIETHPTDICRVCEQAVSNLKNLADQKGLKLKYDSNQCVMAMADADRLKEVINNLLSNAIKYSESGEIKVYHTQDSGHIITHVQDQGMGISEADQKRIFTRFFRSDSVVDKAPGTGLGLFIVKKLIERMGGRVWFSSTKGKGTTFSFSLESSGVTPPNQAD